MSARSQSSGRGLISDMEIEHIKLEHEEIQVELKALRKMAKAVQDGGRILLSIDLFLIIIVGALLL